MATDKPRFTITLEEETFEGVMSYKKKNKLSTQSKAIQQLVELGLEDVLKGVTVKPTAKSEIESKYNALDDHGKALVDSVLDLEFRRCAGVKAQIQPRKKIIPLFGVSFAAGPGEPDTEAPFEDYEVDADSKAEFAIRISGDSMEPELHDGEIALCTKRKPQIGEIVVCLVNGSFYVKQFITDGMNIYLRSVNRKRKDADLDIWHSGNDTVKCFGTVIHKRIPLVQQ